MAGGVEFLGRLEYRLGTEGGPGVVAGEQGLEFADDLLGGYLNLEGGNPKALFTDRENAAGSLNFISSATCLMVVFEF